MNNARRFKIQKAIDLLDEVITDEQDAHDNLPESLQDSTKGEKMDEDLDSLQEAKDSLEGVLAG